MIRGIDISHHQGTVDFRKVKAAGYNFVIVKATEGTGFVDPNFRAYRAQAHAVGLIVGLYHFVGSSSSKRIFDATAEADFFAKTVGPLQTGEFAAEDFEPYGYSNLRGVDLGAWSRTWLDRVRAKLGVKPLIYLDRNNRSRYDWSRVIAGDYGLWLAVYDDSTSQPGGSPWPAAAMKQYSASASVPGISGHVDVDAFYGTTDQLLAYGKGGTPPEEDDMTPEQAKQLAEIHQALNADTGIGDPRTNLGDASKRTKDPASFFLAWSLYFGDKIRNVQIPRMERMLTEQSAQIGALTAMVAKGGGLTETQAQAAAKAGAAAALAELGDALSALPDEGAEA